MGRAASQVCLSGGGCWGGQALTSCTSPAPAGGTRRAGLGFRAGLFSRNLIPLLARVWEAQGAGGSHLSPDAGSPWEGDGAFPAGGVTARMPPMPPAWEKWARPRDKAGPITETRGACCWLKRWNKISRVLGGGHALSTPRLGPSPWVTLPAAEWILSPTTCVTRIHPRWQISLPMAPVYLIPEAAPSTSSLG